MPREREGRGSNKRVFTLTGLSPDERTDVGKMIKTLESVFVESRVRRNVFCDYLRYIYIYIYAFASFSFV